MASSTDRFLASLGEYEEAGFTFFSQLPSADVLDASLLHRLTSVYTDLRASAGEGVRLAAVGSFSVAQGVTWALKERLAGILLELHRAGVDLRPPPSVQSATVKARDVLLVLAGGAVALVIAGVVLLAVGGETATAPTPTPAPTPTASPTQDPSPSPYQRRLTGVEAAANVRREANEDYISPVESVIGGWRDCEASDFNESSRSWVVQCNLHLTSLETGKTTIFPSPGIWLINDSTGEVTRLQ